MSHIIELPEVLANQIAAGEVIERPASVVKELVENAIDAGSSQIIIEIEEAGLKKIQITDNGHGIAHDEVELALRRHATSKIKNQADLFRIRTLGFRGEALASISSVSRVIIKSCAGEAQGKMLVLEAGKVTSEEYYAPIKGTDLSVENLFYNTPARLKYLRNAHTEQANITNVIYKFALSYPNVSFELHVDDKITFKTYGDGDVHKILSKIYNMSVARNMINFSGNNDDYKVYGYISVPDETRASKNYINIFINGRYIRNYIIQNSIIDAYGTLLMKNRYPLCVINIDMDPILLDVNVHPTKQEVRLSKEAELISLIKGAISERLANYTYIPQGMNNVLTKKEKANIEKFNFLDELDNKFGMQTEENNTSLFNKGQNEANFVKEDDLVFGEDNDIHKLQEELNSNNESHIRRQQTEISGMESSLPDLSYTARPRENYNKYGDKPTKKEIENFMNFSKREEIGEATKEEISNTIVKDNSHFDEIKNLKIVQDESMEVKTLPDLKVLAQIFKTYILSEADNKLYLIDQHAAAERYNYEKLQRDFIDRKNYKKQMLIPMTFDFSIEEAAEIRNNFEKFTELGIDFEEFGDNSYVVREFPGWIEEDEEEMIKIIVEKVLNNNKITFNELRNDAIAMASCKMSIKANQILSEVEMNKVISDLYKCKNPFTCPHGRPIITKMEKKDLEKMFKRIV